MSTTFPTTALQDMDATRGTATQALNSPSHVTHHTLEDDTLEALQAKVGIDNSAVTTSLDYILKNTTAGHDHDGTDSKKVIVTNLDVAGLTSSRLIQVNSGGTALESTATPRLTGINDTNGNEQIIFTTTASAVNEITVTNAATGSAPEISATGGDTNINISVIPKGTTGLFLGGRVPACKVYPSAAVSIPDNTITVITFNTEEYDNNVMHDTVTNNSRITIKTAGVYLVSYVIFFDNNATGRRAGLLRKNGTAITGAGDEEATPNATNATVCTGSIPIDCAVNDYLEVAAYQTSGGALNVKGGALNNDQICSFSVVRLGGNV